MAQQIQVLNISTLLAADTLPAILSAIEAQANGEVLAEWQTPSVKIMPIVQASEWSDGAWRFVIADTADDVKTLLAGAAAQVSGLPGLEGEHFQPGAVPIGFALMQPTLSAGATPSVTISHEIVEMIADPDLRGHRPWLDGSELLLELCDPVQGDSCAYYKNGIKVSNFVTQAYFTPGSVGPWAHCNVLLGPNTVVDDGYQLQWTADGGSAMRIVPGAAGRISADFATSLSRRMRRAAKMPPRSLRVVAPGLVAAAQGQGPAGSGGRFGKWFIATALFAGLLVGCGAWISHSAWKGATAELRDQWLAVEAVLIGLCAFVGLATKGRIDGILIDEENRISLSRLQWVIWFAILLGGFFAESIWNVAAGWSDGTQSFPDMQQDLWALLGIVSASAVTSNLIVDSKKNLPPPPGAALSAAFDEPHQGAIDCNLTPSEASWQDLYLGEEVANRNVVDVSRLQKLVVTILLAMTYVQLLWTVLAAGPKDSHGHIMGFKEMPTVDQGFLWLLGISHAAYLAYKATPKTPVTAALPNNPAAKI